MNAYLNRMTELIHDKHGTIDKYIGDAIMAFWGAPLEDPDHATHAVETAIAMRDALPSIWEEFEARGWPQIRIGIGINTGMMAVGNMGSDFRMAYTVMGDAVNTGSRVEGLTKLYGVTTIVTESTAKLASGFRYRLLDRVRVVGREEPVDIFEPLMHVEEVPEELDKELVLYDEFLEQYRRREWDAALELLDDLDRRFETRPLYDLYRNRIHGYIEEPPGEDWAGVFVLDKK